MIKIDLPDNYNSKQIQEAISALYPDVKIEVKPGQMSIKGSGNNPKIDPPELRLDMSVGSPSEIARIEQGIRQLVFGLVPEKTDAQEKQEDILKKLLLGPAFVYILSKIEGLENEIDKLKEDKTTTNGEPKNEKPK